MTFPRKGRPLEEATRILRWHKRRNVVARQARTEALFGSAESIAQAILNAQPVPVTPARTTFTAPDKPPHLRRPCDEE